MNPILVFILFGLIVLLVILLQYLARQRRIKELSAWCSLKGLCFSPARDDSIWELYPEFQCLQRGDNFYAYDVMTGDWHGYELIAFDYQYETHSSDGKGNRQTQTHRFSATILTSKVPLKPLLIRPEGLFDKFKSMLGFEDINFESVEFNRAFYVQSPDKRWAYDVIHPRTMEFLLAAPRDFTIEFGQFQIIAYNDRVFSAENFTASANLIEGLLDRLPQYLVQAQTGESR